MKYDNPRESLRGDIVLNDLCIGCGACAALSNSELRMQFDDYGMLKPEGGEAWDDTDLLKVCPFSDQSANESAIADKLWPDASSDLRLGRYRGLYAGQIEDEEDRLAGSSGGLTTWILREMLVRGIVDRVAHVKPANPKADSLGRYFRYEISTSVEQLNEGRGSRYYPIELSEIVDQIRRQPGRYAVVAIPCMAKALRNLMSHDAVVADRVHFIVGLVCGHLKSRHFADFIADTQGVRAGAFDTLSFRHKLPERPASDYSVSVTLPGKTISGRNPLKEYFATSWEIGAFRNPACDFCDDVLAETADIVFGDAWIPPYDAEWQGTNVILTRNETLHRLLCDGADDGRISLDQITPDQMAQSQAGGLRHRREGLAYRLYKREEKGIWHPRKRVDPIASGLSVHRMAVYDRRVELSQVSHKAYNLANTLGTMLVFKAMMSWPVFAYYRSIGNTKRALSQTVLGRWLKRRLPRRGRRI
jgi:coenzyme F420 hydrogenase subunit beta